jgi:hypothetical protein
VACVDRVVDAIETAHRLFLTDDLAAAYRMGAQAAAVAAGRDVVWTQMHREALQALASTSWGDTLKATRYIRADTKRTLRKLASSAAARTALGEATAQRAGRDLAEAARKATGMLTVRYKNGARHSMSDWADTSARTSSALAFNEGTFVQADQDGIRWMECIDGPACGLDFHGVAPFANGMVLSTREAREHPLAHPRCARSWSPRPDAKGPDRSGRTPDAFEAAEEENRRAATRLVGGQKPGYFSVARELQRHAPRPPRAPRSPRPATPTTRAPRVPRKPTTPPRAPAVAGRGPVGRSIDEFLDIDPNLPTTVRQAVDHATEQMGKVHGYGNTRMTPAKRVEGEGLKARLLDARNPGRVPVRELDVNAEENGRFRPTRVGNNPLDIEIKRIRTIDDSGRIVDIIPDPGTVAHELGHLADISFMTPSGDTWASKAAWEMRRLTVREQALAGRTDDASQAIVARTIRERTALAGSKDPEMLRAFGQVFDAIAETETYRKTSKLGSGFWRDYANTPQELWARAYAQWITDRSGSALMRERLDADLLKRNQPLADQIGYGHEQWMWDEFGPVAEAIDNLMRVMGWMT